MNKETQVSKTPKATPKAPKVAPKVTKETKEVKAAPAKAAPKAPKLKKSTNAPLSHGVGRRKSSIARVWIKPGSGNLTVNDKDYTQYFDTLVTRKNAFLPFSVYAESAKFDASVNVCGGGLCSQADAVKLGVARALVEMNPEIKPLLKEHSLLTVDSRLKERKKYGQKAARRKFQFVKR